MSQKNLSINLSKSVQINQSVFLLIGQTLTWFVKKENTMLLVGSHFFIISRGFERKIYRKRQESEGIRLSHINEEREREREREREYLFLLPIYTITSLTRRGGVLVV